ncbi:MAG: hypothetical protein IKS93_06065 [Methanobrevibacter sp.]|nr:hypothetical protein [Methanobrevibacter sp.]
MDMVMYSLFLRKDKWMGILKYLVKFYCIFFYNLAPLLTSLAGNLRKHKAGLLNKYQGNIHSWA